MPRITCDPIENSHATHQAVTHCAPHLVGQVRGDIHGTHTAFHHHLVCLCVCLKKGPQPNGLPKYKGFFCLATKSSGRVKAKHK